MRSFFLALLAAGCGPSTPETDGGSCDLTVVIATGEAGDLVPVTDGDSSELILGFQGFRMLRFALDVRGASATQAEVSAFVTVPDESIELSQVTRQSGLVDGAEGFIVEDWLVFFNDTPISRLVGRDAELEVLVRAEGCVGGTRVRIMMRDDDQCVDETIVLDAEISDGGIGDAMVCDGGT